MSEPNAVQVRTLTNFSQ